MSSINCKSAIIISKSPIMQTGLGSIMSRYFPDCEHAFSRSQEELTLLQLRRAFVVMRICLATRAMRAASVNSFTSYKTSIGIFTGFIWFRAPFIPSLSSS